MSEVSFSEKNSPKSGIYIIYVSEVSFREKKYPPKRYISIVARVGGQKLPIRPYRWDGSLARPHTLSLTAVPEIPKSRAYPTRGTI